MAALFIVGRPRFFKYSKPKPAYPIRGMPSPIVSKAIIDGSGTDAEIKPCVSKSGLHPPFVMVEQDDVFASCREVTDTDSELKKLNGTNFVLKLRAVKF